MYRIISASNDTYITDKIINNRYRATDANVGQAGTLDLFKLYNESTLSGEEKPVELSRILIKFDYSSISQMFNEGKIDISDASFKTQIKLHDVYGGQTTPSNFKCIVFPLAKSFDEGAGYDIGNFSDLDATNFVTASYSNSTINKWSLPGAMKSGSLTDIATIDVMTSGTLDASLGSESLCFEQYFKTGEEDLEIDVTKIVSASIKSLIPNKGFLVAFSGSYEKDQKSYFVKRFASRNSAKTGIRPKLIVSFDDSINDNHQNFVFDYTGSLYLSNQVRGELKNAKSGPAKLDTAAGENCMILKISTGSFQKTFSVSQAMRGENRIEGLYSSSFAISSFGSLSDHIQTSGSITFDEVWSSSDEAVTFLSSSFAIKKNNISQINLSQTSYHVKAINLNDRYMRSEIARIRVFIESKDREVAYTKKPFNKKSQVYEKMYFRVRDTVSGDIIIPFKNQNNSTKLSSDSNGMYYDFYMDSLPSGKTYIFDYLIEINGYDNVITDAASKFIVV
jgi:hypothetical protein